MARGIVIGIVGTLVVLVLLAYGGIEAGWLPANADAKPSKLERWMAHVSLHAALARQAPKIDAPIPLDDANLISGIKLYAQNCAVCHGAADAAPSKIARGLYQKPPQLAKDGVEDDPMGVTYWKIDHGIRFTAMPSFGATLNDRQIWQLALFLKHMDGLTPSAQRAWKAVGAKPPVPRSRRAGSSRSASRRTDTDRST